MLLRLVFLFCKFQWAHSIIAKAVTCRINCPLALDDNIKVSKYEQTTLLKESHEGCTRKPPPFLTSNHRDTLHSTNACATNSLTVLLMMSQHLQRNKTLLLWEEVFWCFTVLQNRATLTVHGIWNQIKLYFALHLIQCASENELQKKLNINL